MVNDFELVAHQMALYCWYELLLHIIQYSVLRIYNVIVILNAILSAKYENGVQFDMNL